MAFAQDQIDELKGLCAEVSVADEGGTPIFLLRGLGLPSGTKPNPVDALLWPALRDGYQSRLFYAEPIACTKSINWTVNGVMIAERTWSTFSWQTRAGLRLAQMVLDHLQCFRA